MFGCIIEANPFNNRIIMKKLLIFLFSFVFGIKSYAQQDSVPHFGIGTEIAKPSIWSGEIRLAWRSGPYLSLIILSNYELTDNPELSPINLLNFLGSLGYGITKNMPGILKEFEGSGCGVVYGCVTSTRSIGIAYQDGYYFNLSKSIPIFKSSPFTFCLNMRFMKTWVTYTHNERGLKIGVQEKPYDHLTLGFIVQR